MSNKLLWILIILIFILSLFAFILYAFIYNNAKIIINSNVSNYNVSIYNKKTLKKYNFECVEKKCELNDILPFDYKLTVTKKQYNDYIKEISVSRNKKININIYLEKKVILEEISKKSSKFPPNKEDNKNIEKQDKLSIEGFNPLKNSEETNKKLTNKEKIQALISKKNKLKNSLNKVEEKIKLEQTKNSKYKFLEKIHLFKNTDYSKIKVLETSWNINIFFIEKENKKYIYNKTTWNLYNIDLNIPTIYLKHNSNSEIDLVTEKWIFTYSIISRKLEYFTIFRDYINYKWNYIWVVKSDDKTRKNNFWFENEKQNLIILYNRKNFTKKIIYKTEINIDKILLENNEIIIISNEKKFKLSNFD